jgi:copper homeostasis protein
MDTHAPRTPCDRAAVNVPVRVMLRDRPGYAPGDLDALRRTAARFPGAGFVLGVRTPARAVDTTSLRALLPALEGCPWTFHRAIDHARDRTSAWRALAGLPGLDTVLTAGAPSGAEAGLPVLCTEAPVHKGRVLAGGGLRPEHVPVLRDAGVRAFHIGTGARPGGAWHAPVDAGLVRRWRTLATM